MTLHSVVQAGSGSGGSREHQLLEVGSKEHFIAGSRFQGEHTTAERGSMGSIELLGVEIRGAPSCWESGFREHPAAGSERSALIHLS